VTVVATIATPLELDILIGIPPTGAGPERVTVPVDEVNPVTVVGLKVTETRVAGFIVRFAVKVTVRSDADIETGVWEATAVVFTVNVDVDFPGPIVTLAGTVADFLLLASLIVTLVRNDGFVNVIVPIDDVPPETVIGLSVSERIVGAVTVRLADFVLFP